MKCINCNKSLDIATRSAVFVEEEITKCFVSCWSCGGVMVAVLDEEGEFSHVSPTLSGYGISTREQMKLAAKLFMENEHRVEEFAIKKTTRIPYEDIDKNLFFSTIKSKVKKIRGK